MSISPLNVRLEQYEGPLDLLLDLIRKQQIDIWNIPIAQITSQYLEYLDRAAALDIEINSEFIFMAAQLIHIKSKMLLPTDPELEKISPEDDPRRELVERLLEHERFKNAAEMLQQKRLIEENVWSNPQMKQFASEEDVTELDVTLFDLVKTFEQVLERAKARPTYELTHEEISVPEMIGRLRSMLETLPRNQSIPALQLFEEQTSRRAIICLFLAILEMVKMQAIVLVQKELFGEIGIRQHKRYKEVFSSEQDITTIDKDYN